MILKEFNNLIDLYFYQAKKENPNTPFLEWLNPKNKKAYTDFIDGKKKQRKGV